MERRKTDVGKQLDAVIAIDGTSLALHLWTSTVPRGLLFYIHGIQSHAGWLFETGPELARRGIAVCALDRRGSGRSNGPRGDVPNLDLLLDDYLRAFQVARLRFRSVPVTLLGQSLGGSVLAGLFSTGQVEADRLVFCAPALAQMRAKLSAAERTAVRAETGQQLRPIGLRDEDYTNLDKYLHFMAEDRLMLRHITQRSRAAFLALEDYYMAARGRWNEIPVTLVLPKADPIIRLDAAAATLRELSVRRPTTVEFDCDRHYLEFSPVRRNYWDWMAEHLAAPAAEAAQ